MVQLPFSQACENNKRPIWNILKDLVKNKKCLEIGFGTGQHCEFFCSQDLTLDWTPCDPKENHWIIEYYKNKLTHLNSPCEFYCLDDEIQTNVSQRFDLIFTANTLHIMNYKHFISFCSNISQHLNPKGKIIIYGPFKYHDKFIGDGNFRFDQMLRERNSESGLREFNHLCALLKENNILLEKSYSLPANNQLHIFNYDI